MTGYKKILVDDDNMRGARELCVKEFVIDDRLFNRIDRIKIHNVVEILREQLGYSRVNEALEALGVGQIQEVVYHIRRSLPRTEIID